MSIPARLRKKRWWNVNDFAEFIGASHKVALARLHTFNAQMGGMLLIPSGGQRNRRYTFSPALLAKAIDDGRLALAGGLFGSIDALDARLGELEERVTNIESAQRIVAAQCGVNTRDIHELRGRPSLASGKNVAPRRPASPHRRTGS